MMNQPPHSANSSKLFVRSEVLAVITFLSAIDEPSRQDKVKQIKRLQGITDQGTVLQILVKELQRATHSRTLQVITELLMELGKLDTLHQPLWQLIEDPKSSDDIKDASNLILRHLGDESDPNLYLNYLDDPSSLINRETERMLEVSSRNPEALIDFLDFIFSLPVTEQCNLIGSLQKDYTVDYLLNLYFPLLLALPPLETQEFVINLLGQSRSPRAALFLEQNEGWFQIDPRLTKATKKALSSLKIGGACKETELQKAQSEAQQPHPMVTQSEFYQCFATIPDGIGNQGIVISRERENGDICMMSVAINDLHGVIDCFGFYELSKPDFHKLIEKFHEENTKIHTPPLYCFQKLQAAEAINHRHQFRIPYEYSCWKSLLKDEALFNQTPLEIMTLSQQWGNESWGEVSVSLYQHPDFSTWFLEEGDHPVVTTVLEEVMEVCARALAQEEESLSDGELKSLKKAFVLAMDQLAERLTRALLATEWREVLQARLADAAYLLNEQKANTFARLAATEVLKLSKYNPEDEAAPLTGFIRHYGRRCIEEDLLRLKQGAQSTSELKNNHYFEQLVDAALTAWELPL